MKISFGGGLVKIGPNRLFNPANVLTVNKNSEGSCDILFNDCICISGIKANIDDLAQACTTALNENKTVTINEKDNNKKSINYTV